MCRGDGALHPERFAPWVQAGEVVPDPARRADPPARRLLLVAEPVGEPGALDEDLARLGRAMCRHQRGVPPGQRRVDRRTDTVVCPGRTPRRWRAVEIGEAVPARAVESGQSRWRAAEQPLVVRHASSPIGRRAVGSASSASKASGDGGARQPGPSACWCRDSPTIRCRSGRGRGRVRQLGHGRDHPDPGGRLRARRDRPAPSARSPHRSTTGPRRLASGWANTGRPPALRTMAIAANTSVSALRT